MPLKIYNNEISGGKVGISVPANSNAELVGNSFHGVETAINQRDEQSLFSALGLPRGTDPKLVMELLEQFKAHEPVSTESVQSLVKDSRLAKALGGSANVAGIATFLLDLHAKGYVQRVVDLLTSL